MAIRKEDAGAKAHSFMRFAAFVLFGKCMGRETDANPAEVRFVGTKVHAAT